MSRARGTSRISLRGSVLGGPGAAFPAPCQTPVSVSSIPSLAGDSLVVKNLRVSTRQADKDHAHVCLDCTVPVGKPLILGITTVFISR
jgi:hypothetical protein